MCMCGHQVTVAPTTIVTVMATPPVCGPSASTQLPMTVRRQDTTSLAPPLWLPLSVTERATPAMLAW